MENNAQRYTRVAIALHWVMACMLFFMIGSGLAFDKIDMPKDIKFNLYQWHKSFGLTVLALVFVRLVWRFIHRPPALPDTFGRFDKKASHIGHWVIYILMFFVPLSGWIMVSSSPYGLPTMYFGWFEWPHIPVIGDKNITNDIARSAHEILAYAIMGIIAIHIMAALKHEWWDKKPLLHRMGLGRHKDRKIKR